MTVNLINKCKKSNNVTRKPLTTWVGCSKINFSHAIQMQQAAPLETASTTSKNWQWAKRNATTNRLYSSCIFMLVEWMQIKTLYFNNNNVEEKITKLLQTTEKWITKKPNPDVCTVIVVMHMLMHWHYTQMASTIFTCAKVRNLRIEAKYRTE